MTNKFWEIDFLSITLKFKSGNRLSRNRTRSSGKCVVTHHIIISSNMVCKLVSNGIELSDEESAINVSRKYVVGKLEYSPLRNSIW